MASSMEATKILPSPILPLRAAVVRVSTTEAASASDHHFQFYLGQQIHLVFLAAIDFLVAFLAAVSADFADGHAFDADALQASFTSSSLNGWMIASIFFIVL